MPWDESLWLVQGFLIEPDSHLFAALAGWENPVSREWILLAAHVDDYRQAHSKRRIRPWDRPWPAPGKTRLGKKPLKIDNVRDVLRRMAGRG